MNMISEFIAEYGSTILYTIVTAIFGFLGMAVKRIVEKCINGKIKTDTARKTVLMVEQMFKDLHGEEKLEKARMYIVDALQEKGISISELELRMLIEAAIAEFNGAFNKNELIPEEDNSDENSVEDDAPTVAEEDVQDAE